MKAIVAGVAGSLAIALAAGYAILRNPADSPVGAPAGGVSKDAPPVPVAAEGEGRYGRRALSPKLQTANLDDTLCIGDEWAVYSCKFGSKMASVCFGSKGGDAVYYRFGSKAKLDIEIKSNGKDGIAKAVEHDLVYYDLVFRRGDHAYTVYTQNAPGPPGVSDWKTGVAVTRGGRKISDLVCPEAQDFQTVSRDNLPNIIAPPWP